MKFGARFRWDLQTDVKENAHRELPRLARKYFKRGRVASLEKRLDKLHEFRLMTKSFRYTLELFRDVYGARLDERIKKLRRLQDVLGRLNDVHVLRTRVADETGEDVILIGGYLDAEISKKRYVFRRRWRT